MTVCIFEACRYSRLVEGQERIRVWGGGAGGVDDKKGSGGVKKKNQKCQGQEGGSGDRDKKEWQDG